ncbi:hypothetical protein O7N74_004505 [Salmonella enterica]|nr:hypothetical protein [Salmonella enterica]
MKKQTPDEGGKRPVLSDAEREQIEAEIETGEVYRSIGDRHDLTHRQVSTIAAKRRERLGISGAFWWISDARSSDDVSMRLAAEMGGKE